MNEETLFEFSQNETETQEPSSLGVESEAVPLSFAQQRLWFLDQLHPESCLYNIGIAIRIRGPLRIAALRQALNEIVRRHESLRTRFIACDGVPRQFIQAPRALEFPVIDLRSVAPEFREAETARFAEIELLKPFDLRTDLMIRAHLLQLDPCEHLLLLTIHHIAADGWSMNVLFRELGALYKSCCAGEASPLPDLPVQYADFAEWQRDYFDPATMADQIAYWRGKLENAPDLELPTDHPRPRTQSFRGAVELRTIPAELRERLEDLARRENTTLFNVLLAAFQIVLHRYSGQEDIVIGTPISGRNRVEIEDLIGFFVNTLALRSSVAGGPSFRELLQQIRENVLEAFAHQDLPFDKLVEELRPERVSSYNPICRVLFTLQRAPSEPLRLGDLQLSLEPVPVRISKFDLTLYIIEDGPALNATAEYSTDLFNAETMRRMLEHLHTILESIAADPDQRISQLPMLTSSERTEMIERWNDTVTEFPRHVSVPELFEQQVRRCPNAVAVVYGERHLTYEELNRGANRIAYHLRELNVQRETLVGVCLDRSPEFITALVGIFKAGGAYVPLDGTYPAERLAFMIEDTEMPVVLTNQKCRSALPQNVRARLVCLEDLPEKPVENIALHSTADDLAYIIYTSGSTGKPKGVCVQQRAINRLIFNTNYIQIQPADRIAQASNSSFDAATFEIWGALLHGATLVGIEKDVMLSPRELTSAIRQQNITTLFLTTALFNQIAAESPTAFAPLKHLLFGGEAVDPKWVREVLQHGAPERLLHVYGPTETTTFATWFHVRQVPANANTIPIGWPLSNTECYVLDANLEPVPIGVPGELYIGGDALARGYWQRPSLTAARFVHHPFAKHSEARLYKTGDRVRWLSDGALEFVGRTDYQVKVRGFRIELEEIENALTTHPAVEQAVVAAWEDSMGGKQLAAYVTRPSGVKNENAGNEGERDQVAKWRSVFNDHVYGPLTPISDPTFNIKGWHSSSTGEPIPENEMREWLEDTLAPLLSRRPQRVLEIGCGTGMLLFRIASQCEHYVGTDISETALQYVQEQLHELQHENVELFQRSADDFTGFEDNSFDAIILNSVVQYFPDIHYLVRVIEQAVQCLRPGGFIFLGDVRSFALQQAFHASIQFSKADKAMPIGDFARLVQLQAAQETELLVHPEFFTALKQSLPDVGKVRVMPKQGKAHNELTKFRYQIFLEAANATSVADQTSVDWLNWDEKAFDATSFKQFLRERQPSALGLRGVGNARLSAERFLVNALTDDTTATIGDLRQAVATASTTGVDPDELATIARGLGYSIEFSWATHDAEGAFDVLIHRSGIPQVANFPEPIVQSKPWQAYANCPLQAELAPQLRAFLQTKMPDYMVPSSFMVLDRLPLTPNGKVDRAALPRPDRPAVQQVYAAPRGELETRLQEIWEDVLGRKGVGIHDNFFELGGHSLLAVRLFAQIENHLEKKIPLSALFLAPTIAHLAARIQENSSVAPANTLVEIQPKGSQPPIFWLHTLGGGGGGGLFTYHKLAELLGPDQPSYGLVAPPEPFTSIEKMAAHYIQEMRRIQPAGPYQLGGYCFGGIVAFEMARQLEAASCQVDFLALLDSVPPNVESSPRILNGDSIQTFAENLPLWLGDLLKENPRELWRRFRRKVKKWQRMPAAFRSTQNHPPKVETQLEDIIDMSAYPPDFKRFARIHWSALIQYVPQSYTGRVCLFRTRQPYRLGLNPEALWNKLALGGVDVCVVPGRHEDILESPNVEVLAKEITDRLESARRPVLPRSWSASSQTAPLTDVTTETRLGISQS